ncbi:hypothetical protein [Micromonospora sp. HUAS LYJ1]|uniref:hypothetical protein n=1 Tax=Micromonospora sp. HUAS LYJ1 TaxID=3061626 RepID=UPI0026727C27|nr:hypothetical protein [Micromonospora sp. HUAS LYJ1]WKU03838.1 hypothetical protein Q2K16_23810 [Micromonospora sp. HUAS LYJ1]
MTYRPYLLPLVAAGCLALAACGGGSPPADGLPDPTTTPAATTPAADTPTTSRPLELTDGIYEVGADILPGTYTATAGSRPCYWARLRSFGQPSSIIAEDNLEPGERQQVTIRASDRGFKAANGCRWRLA